MCKMVNMHAIICKKIKRNNCYKCINKQAYLSNVDPTLISSNVGSTDAIINLIKILRIKYKYHVIKNINIFIIRKHLYAHEKNLKTFDIK